MFTVFPEVSAWDVQVVTYSNREPSTRATWVAVPDVSTGTADFAATVTLRPFVSPSALVKSVSGVIATSASLNVVTASVLVVGWELQTVIRSAASSSLKAASRTASWTVLGIYASLGRCNAQTKRSSTRKS